MKKEIQPDQFFTGMPSLTALKAFVASARYNSFTDASKALCVTQSAVSRQVRELESSLNVCLFSRVGRSIELTEEGKKLYETAYICFSHISQTANGIKVSEGNSGRVNNARLTIAMTHAFSVLWMANKMRNFRSEFPDIELAIYAVDDSLSMADDSNIDGYLSMQPTGNLDYISTALFSEEVYPVCSPTYFKEHPEIGDMNNLHHPDLLHLRGSQAHQGFGWKQWFEFANMNSYSSIDEASTTVAASNYQFLIQMAIDSQGVSLGWDHLVKNLIRSGKLVRPVSETVYLRKHTHYFTHKRHSEKEYEITQFRNWLIGHF